MRIYYDFDLEDDEWRESNFSESDIQSASHMNVRQPIADELIKAAEKYGTEGILESAIMLPQRQFQKVHIAVENLNRKDKR